ncbi:MAG TPA: hypothetical protein VFQ61_28585 [Polyangiaceae bacterium]|nr:hypothetical protein [Polyangiaceae bacterium]
MRLSSAWQRTSAWRVLSGLAGALLWSSSCSLVYDLSPDQCGATPECTGRFGAGYVCEAGLCKKTGSGGRTSTGGGGSGGTSNSSGSSGLGGSSGGSGGRTSGGGTAGSSDETGGTGGEPFVPECDTHAECLTKYGDVDPRACVEGTCVLLKSNECPLILPLKGDQWLDNLKNSNAIVMGVYSPIPPASLLSNYTRFADLALTEETEEVKGLPGPNGKRRQIVMVVCDGGTPTTDQLRASGRHLMEELKVPGIVSNLQSADLQFVFEEYAQAAGTFVMSALDADDSILNLQDEGRVWTMLAGPDQVAVTVPPLLDRTIDYLRSKSVLEESENVRVALVAPTGEPRLLGDMAEAIRKTIRFNGKSALDNFPDNFKLIDIETVYGDAEAAKDQSGVVSELLGFKPHVILAMATNEFLSTVIPGLEGQWSSAAAGQARPFYVLSPYHLGNVAMPTALGAESTVRTRMVGVGYAAAEDRSVYQDYILRLDQAYPEIQKDSSRLGLENFYDAPYYLIYAAAAAGNPPQLTGDLLAKGMTRLIKGNTSYEIGRDDMVEAFGFLQANAKNTITLKGTLGPANFDESTGARADGGSVFCMDTSNKFAPDILRWNSASEMFVDAATPIGTACIPGF